MDYRMPRMAPSPPAVLDTPQVALEVVLNTPGRHS
jgi:hypothetical protein